MAFGRFVVRGALAVSALVAGCGGPACPDGTVESDGRCVSPEDTGSRDAGAVDAATLDAGMLDAFVVMGTDAPLPDVFVPMGVDAGELPDVFVELPDAFVPPDACSPSTFYVDGDGDGHGDPAMTVLGCVMPTGAASLGDDCNDAANAVHPGATEACDGADQDCDARLDEGSGPIAAFYPDADGDGHGAVGGASVMACAAPPGRAALADDCNDGANTIYPGATELCNGVDEDCDSGFDESVQRLLRTPHEVIAPGGVDFDFINAAPMGAGYVIAYSAPALTVRRVARDGTTLGAARVVSASGYLPQVIPVSDTRAVAVFSRIVTGTTYSVHAVTIDFGVEPSTLGTEIEVGRGVNAIAPIAALLEGRLVVMHLVGSATVARTYATDLSSPSPAVTLFGFRVTPQLLVGDGASWITYNGTRPATSREDCYAQRLIVSPLSLDTTVVTLGDSSGPCELLAASAPSGHAYAFLSYTDAARFEGLRATLAGGLTITRRTPITLTGPLASVQPGWGASSAGADLAYATAPGTPAALGQLRHLGATGSTSAPSSFGGAGSIPAYAIARSSSQHGAIVYVATPTGGSTHALYLQEIGCE